MSENTGRCSSWYYQAACLGSQLPVSKTIIEILDKLYQKTDKYVDILNNARVEAFGFTQQISQASIDRLMALAKLEHDLREG